MDVKIDYSSLQGQIRTHPRLFILSLYLTLKTVLLNLTYLSSICMALQVSAAQGLPYFEFIILVGRYLIVTSNEGSPRRKGGQMVSAAASYQGLLFRLAILKGVSLISPVTAGKCRGNTLTQTTKVSFHFRINLSLVGVVEQIINKYIHKKIYTTIREEFSVVWHVASCGWLNSAVSVKLVATSSASSVIEMKSEQRCNLRDTAPVSLLQLQIFPAAYTF